MKSQNVLKRTLAGVLAVLTVAGSIPANVGTGGLFGGSTIVASAENVEVADVDSFNDALVDGNTVKLTEAVAVDGQIVIPANANVTIDLNQKALSATEIVVNEGATLTLQPSSGYASKNVFTGNITVKSGASLKTAKTKIVGTVTGEEGSTIDNTIDSSYPAQYVPATGSAVITSGTFLAKGTITSVDAPAIISDGNLTITSGTITGETALQANGGTVTITGGTLNGKGGQAIENNGADITVSWGTFQNNGGACDVSAFYADDGVERVFDDNGKLYDISAIYWEITDHSTGKTTYSTSTTQIQIGNATVKLWKDVTVSNIITSVYGNSTSTLDLNGFNVTCTAASRAGILPRSGHGITVINTGENKDASVNLQGLYADINNASLTIGEDVTVNGEIAYFANSEVNIYGSVITDKEGGYAISGNHNQSAGSVLNIYDGALVEAANGIAIYHPQDGTINIYGGTVTGETAVYIRTGTLNISGGELIATGDSSEQYLTANGAEATGDAIAVQAYPSAYGNAPVVNISGGNITSEGENTSAVSVYQYIPETANVSEEIDKTANLTIDNEANVSSITVEQEGDVSIQGGNVDTLTVKDGDAQISGGTVSTVETSGDSLNITGGEIGSVTVTDTATVQVDNGNIGSITANGDTTVQVNGGAVGTVDIADEDNLNYNDGTILDRQGEGGTFYFSNKSRISSIVISGIDEDDEPYEDKVNLKRYSETEVNAGETVTVITKAPIRFKNPAWNDIALESITEDDTNHVYEYTFIMPGWDVNIEYETYDIGNWVGAEIEAESDNGRFYPGDEITIVANEKDNIGWDEDGNWVELTDPLDTSVYDAETGKYTYTVVMPRRDITVRGYAHEHQYEYTVDGAQVIRTCTLKDGEQNDDCEPAVMTLIANDWDNGPIASESVVFNPMGTVNVWLTDLSDGSWIDFYQVDEDGNETPYDYYDYDRTPVGKYKAVAHYLAPDGEYYEPTLEFTVTPFDIFAYNFTAYEPYTSFGNDNNRLNDDDDNTASGTYTTYDPDGVQLNVNGMIDWGENKYWLQEDIDYEVLGRTIAKGFGANSTVIRMMGNFKGEITVNWDIELPDKLDPDFEVNRFGENNFYQEQEYGYTWGELLDTLGFNDNTNYNTEYDGSPERLSDDDISYQYFNTDENEWVDFGEDDTVIPVGNYQIRAVFNGEENKYFNSGVSTNAGNINITPRNLWVKTDDAGVSKNDVDSSLGALEQAAADLVTIYAYDENGTEVPVDIDNANFVFRFYRHDDESNTDYLVENNDQLAELALGERIHVYITGSSDLGNDNYSLGYSFSNYDNESGTDVYTDEYIGDIRITGSAEIKEENITYTAKQIANGEWLSPDVKVYDDDGNELVLGQDYVLRGDKKASEKGVYTIIVQGWGDTYDGCPSIELNWEIVDAPDAKFYSGNNVTFAESITLNFFAEIADEYTDGAYVVFTYDHYGEEKTVTADIPANKFTGTNFYQFTCPLQFPEMAVKVKAELYVNGYDMPVSEAETSIKDYCERMLARDTTSQKTKDAIIATLNFGGYSQITTDKNNDADLYANKDLDPELQDVSDVVVESANEFIKPTETVGGVEYVGASLMLRDSISVRYYFRAESLDNVVFTINGIEKTPETASGMYFIEADPIKSYNLDSVNEVVVTTADGEMSFDHTALNYAQSQSTLDTSNATTVKAMYAYYKAVRAYANMD